MGASVAYHLTRRGVTDVILFEREAQLGTGSTGRNAGGVRHQFSDEANVRLSIESIRAFERFGDEVGYPVDLHQDGYLFLLGTESSVEVFRENVARQRRLGVDVRWVSPSEAVTLAPGLNTEGITGATFCPHDGIADPSGVTSGFARAARAAGAMIARGVEVTGIEVESGRVIGLQTTAGAFSTRALVNAAGPYARHVARMAGVELPVDPFRRHIFIAQPPSTHVSSSVSEAPGEAQERSDWGNRAPHSRVMVIDFETTFYFHREGTGLLFGMADPDEEPTFDTTVQWDFLPKVVDVAVKRLPVLAEASVSHAWAGLYEVTPDANPIIGPAGVVDGLFLINGFSGHGFQHSPAAGRILADVILGVDPHFDLAPFRLDRFSSASRSVVEAGGERYFI
jgi:sarcosine oxidase subunit beta